MQVIAVCETRWALPNRCYWYFTSRPLPSNGDNEAGEPAPLSAIRSPCLTSASFWCDETVDLQARRQDVTLSRFRAVTITDNEEDTVNERIGWSMASAEMPTTLRYIVSTNELLATVQYRHNIWELHMIALFLTVPWSWAWAFASKAIVLYY